MNRIALVVFCFVIASACFADPYCTGKVLKWIDGDTLSVDCVGIGKSKVRLVGVDTPESRDNQKLYRDLKRSAELTKGQVITAGKKAKAFAEQLCGVGSEAAIDIDTQPKDNYDRILGFLFCNGHFVNAELVKQGWAIPYSVPPNTMYAKEFTHFGQEAFTAKRGAWAESIFQEQDILREHGKRKRTTKKKSSANTPAF